MRECITVEDLKERFVGRCVDGVVDAEFDCINEL
jgi:hypothetical protein